MAFDIETTSTYVKNEKTAFMYIWMFGIDDTVYYGRTWEEFTDMVDELSSQLNLSVDKRIIVYVHSLAFEFQFIYKLFKWHKVFSLSAHKPIYAVTENGIEFRCSYLLSGYKLEKLAENLTQHKVEKLVGNLDYDLVRHSKTELTEKELAYCENDVIILLYYIKEQIEEHHNNITYVPLTNTGRVRNYCRKQTLYSNYEQYHSLISSLQLTEEEYEQCKRAFQGGFTHAAHRHVGKVIQNVTSKDFASSYPYTMVSEKFPMSAPRLIEEIDDLEYYLDTYCCMFDVEFSQLNGIYYEHTISASRCTNLKGAVIDNGRIAYADSLVTTITEQDYRIIEQFYEWDTMTIWNFRIMDKEYLPRSFIMAILKLYGDKTSLKNVEGKEVEYLRSKGMINSCYGMTVTDIARDEVNFDGVWTKTQPDLKTVLEKYNRSKRRFLYYPWGVWVTAYARRNLFSGIYEFGKDYVYADTDSIKVTNIENHIDYINKYNKEVELKLIAMCKYYDIPVQLTEPKTPKGVTKRLGVWDDDGEYTRFKTLGAKRYLVEEKGEIHLTVAGLNKYKTVPYLVKTYEDVFEAFDDDLSVPSEYTGKMTHTYIDDEMIFNITDYQGVTDEVYAPSGVHLEKAPYELSLSQQYIDYLSGIKLEMD